MEPTEIEVQLGIVEYPAFPAYVIQRSGLSPAEIGQMLADALEVVFGAGLELAGPPSIAYLEIPADTTAIESMTAAALIPVDPQVATAAGLEVVEVSGLPLAASARFRGPHAAIPQIYGALLGYIQEHQYEVVGLPREQYWEHREDGMHLTELCFPVIDTLPEGEREYEPQTHLNGDRP